MNHLSEQISFLQILAEFLGEQCLELKTQQSVITVHFFSLMHPTRNRKPFEVPMRGNRWKLILCFKVFGTLIGIGGRRGSVLQGGIVFIIITIINNLINHHTSDNIVGPRMNSEVLTYNLQLNQINLICFSDTR